MEEPSILKKEITKVTKNQVVQLMDNLVVEAPLQISLNKLVGDHLGIPKDVSITMRTPGQDALLAQGFLFTEAIIQHAKQIHKINVESNKVELILEAETNVDFGSMERHFYSSSSCGVCGKASIDSIKTKSPFSIGTGRVKVSGSVLNTLPKKLTEAQSLFSDTGGIHAAAIFDCEGNLLDIKEDVGRHNALDKLIGQAFVKETLPLDQQLLMLSGRASFELVQKAYMAGVKCIMAVGSPSSLAVELAQEFDITLVGFLSAERFNVYHDNNRIIL